MSLTRPGRGLVGLPTPLTSKSQSRTLLSNLAQASVRSPPAPPIHAMLENAASVDVPVAVDKVYEMWNDRTRIPSWMPWIAVVEVQEDDPTLSRWVLRTRQFDRDWEFSWMAKNLATIPLQKIHWRSVPGSVGGSLGGAVEVANQGQIRFARLAPATTRVTLTITYELPDVLAPVGSALTPLVEGILRADMNRFKELAVKEHST